MGVAVLFRFVLHGFRREEEEAKEDLVPAVIYQIKESGFKQKWKTQDTVIARKLLHSSHAWYAQAAIQEESHVQWMWALVNSEQKIVRTESIRYRETGCVICGGTLHARWGIMDTYFQNVGNYITFETNYHTKLGERLAIIGSGVHMGSWYVHSAPLADLVCINEWKWQVRIWIENYSVREWKWIVVDGKRNIVRWEDCYNRKLKLERNNTCHIFSPWNKPGEQYVTITVAEELIDRLYKKESHCLQLEKSTLSLCYDKKDLMYSKNLDEKVRE